MKKTLLVLLSILIILVLFLIVLTIGKKNQPRKTEILDDTIVQSPQEISPQDEIVEIDDVNKTNTNLTEAISINNISNTRHTSSSDEQVIITPTEPQKIPNVATESIINPRLTNLSMEYMSWVNKYLLYVEDTQPSILSYAKNTAYKNAHISEPNQIDPYFELEKQYVIEARKELKYRYAKMYAAYNSLKDGAKEYSQNYQVYLTDFKKPEDYATKFYLSGESVKKLDSLLSQVNQKYQEWLSSTPTTEYAYESKKARAQSERDTQVDIIQAKKSLLINEIAEFENS